MFGAHKAPYRISKEELILSINKIEGGLRYGRVCREEEMEKIVSTREASVHIDPVEPLNLPQHISTFLLIEFDNPLLVEPKGRHKIFLKFPVEMAVYIVRKKDFRVIDIFSLIKPKYILYNTLQEGPICRHWRSGAYLKMPAVDKYSEGVMLLDVVNTSTQWIEVSRAVFNAVGMKIYYGPKMVSLKARMSLTGPKTAETDFIDAPFKKGMVKARELFTARKLGLKTTKFIMEGGL